VRKPFLAVMAIALVFTSCGGDDGDRTDSGGTEVGGGATGETSSSAPQSPGRTFTWPVEHEDSAELSFPTATDAVAYQNEYMDGDIALPTWLPSNVRLDVNTSVSVATDDGVRRAWVTLDTQQGDVWGIMYGQSGLDGCDGERHARSVTVSGQPGLLRISPDPDGLQRNWVQLVWPATQKDPEGVYGLFGWLPPRAVVAMAESMPAVAAPSGIAASGC
jgi:hypothetical protein